MQSFLANAIHQDGSNLTGEMVGAFMTAQEILTRVEDEQPDTVVSDFINEFIDIGCKIS